MYDANVIPVGQDQVQHIEMTREIVRKFNNTFGDTFVEPKEFVKKEVATVIGNDGQKMSKSYGNYLALFASEEETEKYIKAVPMDSKEIEEEKNPEDYNLYTIAKLFVTEDQDKELREMFEKGGVGYGDIKKYVSSVINDYLREMRNRRKELEKDPKVILEILKKGGEEAKKVAEEKMQEVRSKIGLNIY